MMPERALKLPDLEPAPTAPDAPSMPPLSCIDLLVVSVAMVIGALIRIDFMVATGFVVDADEAIVGLMAKHILEGKGIPVFYYGQHYMGSLEAILASLSFAVFGVSSYALQLVPLLWSIVLIPVMFLLGRATAGPVAGRVIAILTAIPPVSLVTWSFKARGGFIEIVVLGAIVLLCMVHWLRDSPKARRYAALIGFVSGVGWWVNNQILYFMVPVGIFSALHAASAGFETRSFRRAFGSVVGAACVGLSTFFVGSLPYWWYNIEHGFPSMGMFGLARGGEILEHLEGVFSTALPILLGAKVFWSANEAFPGAVLLLYFVYGSLICLARPLRSGSLTLLIAFLLTGVLVFSVSTFGWLVQAPRYLLPLYVGILVLVGTGVAALMERRKAAGLAVCAILLGLNLETCYFPERAIPGEPFVFRSERVARDHGPVLAALSELGISLVRTNYWIGYRLAFESGERIKFIVFDEPEQVRIPEYETIVSDEEHDVIPLLLVAGQAPLVRTALTALGFTFAERKVGEYMLLYHLQRAARPRHVVPSDQISVAQATGPQDPRGALDGDLHTRWGSGHWQEPGQSFRVEFKEPQRLVALGYHLGAFRSDYPRSLSVEGECLDGSTLVILNANAHAAIHYYSDHESSFRLIFEPIELKAVTLRQNGKHPILDWSIAELRLYADGQ